MPRVGFLGAYSIDNTGDVILGLATRQQVQARVACEEVVLAIDVRLWPHEWSARHGGGIAITRVDPADRGGRFADGLDAVVIGGGGILLPLPGLDPVLAPLGAPSAWNALCSQNTPSYEPRLAEFYAQVRAACERQAYVSVRNAATARFVRRCGWTGEVAIVPDPALAFTSPPDPGVDADLDRRSDRPLVGLSVGNALRDPRASRFHDELLGELERLAAAGAIELVVFPFGRVYGDVDLAERAVATMPHARLVGVGLEPVQTWQLVGKLDLYVCARLHGVLAAYAQGVAFLACDEYYSDATATSKVREFVVDRELEAAYTCPYVGTRIVRRLEQALSGPVPSATALAADRLALSCHFDRMVAALGLGAS